jgi:hypothetical protein
MFATRTALWIGIALLQVAGGTLDAAELFGRVIDANGGPLQDATVELRHEGDPKIIRTFFTDRSGIFRVTDLDAGTYQLSLYCPGFHSVKMRRTVSQDERIALSDVVLQVAPIFNCPGPDWDRPEIRLLEIDEGTELTGKTEEQSGAPIPQAIVTLTSSHNSYRTSSGPKGTFVFSNIEPGLYSLRVRRSGFAEFVIDGLEIRNRHTSEISDALLLPRCPADLKCQPVRNTLRVRICL